MSTNFPTSKQTFTDPTGTDPLNSPDHAGLHTDINDTIEAIQDKLGTAAQDNAPAANKFLRGTGANTSEWDIDFKDEDDMVSDSATAVPSQQSVKAYVDANAGGGGMNNLLKNGNFINNSTNGYGSTPDDWTSSNANPVQGGFPSMTKQQLIDLLGIADGDIEGLWNLNGLVNTDDFDDLSSNAYDLDSAGHVPDVSLDGLMGSALDFEAANTDYGTIDAANLRITGSQTFFCFFKPETVVLQRLMGRSTNAPANLVNLLVGDPASGNAQFQVQNLTTNTAVASDVVMQAGKWYLIVGVYDSANTKLKIWVNGIKKEVTASGTATAAGTETFSIGRCGAYAADYADGLIQNAGVLSVALTDSQVKKLFAATMYRGQKIRRATTDAYLSQTLPEDLVERLRGKEVSIVAKAYQDTASTAQVSIDDGTETASATSATTGSWLDMGVSKTISATAAAITLKLKHSTTDGNTWFKEVAFYEGGTLLYIWYPSYDDISRFPRLLKMDIPALVGGYPYQYEEKRVYKYIPTVVSDGDTQTLASPYDYLAWSFSGKLCSLAGSIYDDAVVGTPNTTVSIGLPIYSTSMKTSGYDTTAMINANSRINGGALVAAFVQPGVSSGKTTLDVQLGATYANGQVIHVGGSYEID